MHLVLVLVRAAARLPPCSPDALAVHPSYLIRSCCRVLRALHFIMMRLSFSHISGQRGGGRGDVAGYSEYMAICMERHMSSGDTADFELEKKQCTALVKKRLIAMVGNRLRLSQASKPFDPAPAVQQYLDSVDACMDNELEGARNPTGADFDRVEAKCEGLAKEAYRQVSHVLRSEQKTLSEYSRTPCSLYWRCMLVLPHAGRRKSS